MEGKLVYNEKSWQIKTMTGSMYIPLHPEHSKFLNENIQISLSSVNRVFKFSLIRSNKNTYAQLYDLLAENL